LSLGAGLAITLVVWEEAEVELVVMFQPLFF
jgi:hypothetical protein